MEVIHDTPENPDVDPVCAECGNPLSDPADLEEGLHFFCDLPDDFDRAELDVGVAEQNFEESGESG